MDNIKWLVANIPTDVLLVLIIVFMIWQFRKINTICKNFCEMQKNYAEHIKTSKQSDREMMRGRLRKLHLEICFAVKAGKLVEEQVIEEFYSTFDIYSDLGGNGYIKHLKNEVDEWIADQRLRAEK